MQNGNATVASGRVVPSSVGAVKNGRRKMEDRHVVIHDMNVIFEDEHNPQVRERERERERERMREKERERDKERKREREICSVQRVEFRPFCIDFCIDCLGLQSSKVNNNTAETV